MPPAAVTVYPAEPASNTNTTDALKDRLSRWKTRLDALTEIHLPTDYPRPIPLQVVEAVHSLQLTEQTSLALLQASMAINLPPSSPYTNSNGSHSGTATPSSTHASPFTILLAAFAILLHRYTGDEDMSIGSSSEARNPVVLRLGVTPGQTFRDIVEKAQLVSSDYLPLCHADWARTRHLFNYGCENSWDQMSRTSQKKRVL